ncbi:hypothetical protein G5I_06523 [Acromyrmex echinatior]|uniref:DNA-directed DNA polymerase n=1 Tax=Acromyrmex echinatior TaxID=103372 RepID=F4WL99_ACREC|nr:hypothetical protein G5I_06523 [Acromyrmex echinatior]
MDNACFAWSVVAALYSAERNADCESFYPHYMMVLNFQNIEFSKLHVKSIFAIEIHLHMIDCRRINDCAIRLPSDDDKWLSFNNYNRKKRIPFVVYADLECILEKTDSDQEASTRMYQHHHVFSIGYYVRCSYDDSLSKYRFCHDPDCVLQFVEKLKSLAYCVKKF